MVRYLFTMLLSVVVAKWCYSEVQLIFPAAIPHIDKTFEVLAIPTHDKWPEIDFGEEGSAIKIAKFLEPRKGGEQSNKAERENTQSQESLDKEALYELLSKF